MQEASDVGESESGILSDRGDNDKENTDDRNAASGGIIGGAGVGEGVYCSAVEASISCEAVDNEVL